jgi:hypothetical protein
LSGGLPHDVEEALLAEVVEPPPAPETELLLETVAESGPVLADPALPVREKLVALRSEVEEFLVELSRPIERRGGKTDA